MKATIPQEDTPVNNRIASLLCYSKVKSFPVSQGALGLDRVSQRTIFRFNSTIGNKPILKSKKTFRNPIIQAKEMTLEMKLDNLTKAGLSRNSGFQEQD